MRTIITIFILSFSLSSFAFNSPEIEKIIIRELNNHCSDSWCESSVEFNFNHLICSEKDSTCELYFTTQDNSVSTNPVYDQHCHFENIVNIESLLKTELNPESGYTSVYLTHAFIAAVNECAVGFIK